MCIASPLVTPEPEVAPRAIILAHVSDIHFRRKRQGSDNYGHDDDLRNEMKRDLGVMARRFGALHGILVTGDVAFSGESEEYKRADQWLTDVCGETGCPEQNIRVISGNHDVKRSAIANSSHLRNAHMVLRNFASQSNWGRLDDEIETYLQDGSVPELLFSPLDEYNKFSAKFLSSFSHNQPFWTWDVMLGDRSTLRIRGLNSALISSSSDNEGDNKLVLGRIFAILRREEGVEYMTLCHHPPQWLWDKDPVEEYLNTRARIQLFGHKHVQRISTQNHGGFDSLRIHAGALNPDQGQSDYLPRYNCISLEIRTGIDGARLLAINVHSRVWDASKTKFDDAAGACHSSVFELDPWNPESAEAEALLAEVATDESFRSVSDPLRVAAADAIKSKTMSAARRLAYRFLSLSYPHQQEIATSLGLLEQSDQGLSDVDLFQRVFRRASERSLLAEMWTKVEARHGGDPGPNPFSD